MGVSFFLVSSICINWGENSDHVCENTTSIILSISHAWTNVGKYKLVAAAGNPQGATKVVTKTIIVKAPNCTLIDPVETVETGNVQTIDTLCSGGGKRDFSALLCLCY